MGLIDPSTSDGRVIFFLPWEGNTIAGTTDVPLTEVIADPVPTEPEIQWILKEVENYLSPDIKVRDSISGPEFTACFLGSQRRCPSCMVWHTTPSSRSFCHKHC